MGRYACFNTGFEYKFVFGTQPSEDIQEFYGKAKLDNEDRKLDATAKHAWSEVDMPSILTVLRKFEELYDLCPIDFSTFETNVKGTYALYYDTYSVPRTLERIHYYKLGCLIYHQLQYQPNLTASYEL